MAQTQYTDSQRARAAALLEQVQTWTRGRRKRDGRAFVLFASSKPGHAYYTAVDGSACTCQGYFHRGACSHALACQLDTAQARERAARRHTDDETDAFDGVLSEAF